MLKIFVSENEKFLIITGEKGYIISENDFCHEVCNLADTQTFVMNKKRTTYTLQEMLNQVNNEVVEMKTFGHYWGIKSRIQDNYSLLLKSVKEIESSDVMEVWPKRY